MSVGRMMTYCFAAIILLAVALSAEVPNLISYQGRLTESDGSPVTDGDYNLTFQVVEHDPVPMGEPILWSSGVQSVTVADGLFVYYLGSNVLLPASIFADDGLESHFVRVFIEGSMLASAGVQLATVPFAFEAINSDTAAYAHSGPGAGATGWVDDGSVVRLHSSGDRVGIGTTSPSENLVVGGGDLGSYEGAYIVSANSEWDSYSGFKLGWDANSHATINWHGDSDQLRFHTRFMGTNYNDNLVLRGGNVGIGVSYPTENLVVGRDLGSYNGHRIVVGDINAGTQTGYMFGEDNDNRGWLLWDIDDNFAAMGSRSGGTAYNNTLVLKEGNVGIGTSNPAGRLHVAGTGNASVQLPIGSISNVEMLNEPGIGRAVQAHAVCVNWDWTTIYSRTCTFPTSGYAVVLVTADLQVQFNLIHLEFGITNNSSVAPHLYTRHHDLENSPNFTIRENFNIHEVFSVSAGSNTFSFVGKSLGDQYRGYIFATSMTVMFFPTSYGTVTTAAGSPDEIVDFSNITEQPRLYTSEPAMASAGDQSFDERIQAETDAIRAEFEQQLQAMREEFQQELNTLTAGRK